MLVTGCGVDARGSPDQTAREEHLRLGSTGKSVGAQVLAETGRQITTPEDHRGDSNERFARDLRAENYVFAFKGSGSEDVGTESCKLASILLKIALLSIKHASRS